MNTIELNKIKTKIEEFERQEQESKARYKILMERLKSDFDCSSIDEAKALLEELQSEIELQEEKLEEHIEILKKEIKIYGL